MDDILHLWQTTSSFDYHPLVLKSNVPILAAAWLQRWAVLLAAYQHDAQFSPTAQHGNADGLSRLPLPKEDLSPDSSIFSLLQVSSLPIRTEQLEKVTAEDPISSKGLWYAFGGLAFGTRSWTDLLLPSKTWIHSGSWMSPVGWLLENTTLESWTNCTKAIPVLQKWSLLRAYRGGGPTWTSTLNNSCSVVAPGKASGTNLHTVIASMELAFNAMVMNPCRFCWALPSTYNVQTWSLGAPIPSG